MAIYMKIIKQKHITIHHQGISVLLPGARLDPGVHQVADHRSRARCDLASLGGLEGCQVPASAFTVFISFYYYSTTDFIWRCNIFPNVSKCVCGSALHAFWSYCSANSGLRTRNLQGRNQTGSTFEIRGMTGSLLLVRLSNIEQCGTVSLSLAIYIYNIFKQRHIWSTIPMKNGRTYIFAVLIWRLCVVVSRHITSFLYNRSFDECAALFIRNCSLVCSGHFALQRRLATGTRCASDPLYRRNGQGRPVLDQLCFCRCFQWYCWCVFCLSHYPQV